MFDFGGRNCRTFHVMVELWLSFFLRPGQVLFYYAQSPIYSLLALLDLSSSTGQDLALDG